MITAETRLFSLESRVSRREYLLTGAVLMAAKYLVDAAVIKYVTGVVWTPLDYLIPLYSLRADKIATFPLALDFFLLAWTLVFMWIGVGMTLRRALDAGKSGWLALWFFVPVVNYVVMLWLAVLPSAPHAHPLPSEAKESSGDSVRSALYGMATGLAIGLAGLVLSAFGFQAYGLTLFLGVPLLASSLAAFVFNRDGRKTQAATDKIAFATIVIIGAAMLMFALEGIVCITMALPLAFIIALLGSRLGRLVALTNSNAASAALIFFLPTGFLAEHAAARRPPTVEIVTTVDVDAPATVVWDKVIRFERIAPPHEWYFQAGIAYPLYATISGSGVGAVRRCVFSTGAFVEPITVWNPGRSLAFSVSSQPQPLQEWSPYRRVYAPHLDNFFVSERGEFRLIPIGGGRTRLEGHTWYHNNMYPQSYWRLFSDPLLHRIHRRVLAEVKQESESSVNVPGGRP